MESILFGNQLANLLKKLNHRDLSGDQLRTSINVVDYLSRELVKLQAKIWQPYYFPILKLTFRSVDRPFVPDRRFVPSYEDLSKEQLAAFKAQAKAHGFMSIREFAEADLPSVLIETLDDPLVIDVIRSRQTIQLDDGRVREGTVYGYWLNRIQARLDCCSEWSEKDYKTWNVAATMIRSATNNWLLYVEEMNDSNTEGAIARPVEEVGGDFDSEKQVALEDWNANPDMTWPEFREKHSYSKSTMRRFAKSTGQFIRKGKAGRPIKSVQIC